MSDAHEMVNDAPVDDHEEIIPHNHGNNSLFRNFNLNNVISNPRSSKSSPNPCAHTDADMMAIDDDEAFLLEAEKRLQNGAVEHAPAQPGVAEDAPLVSESAPMEVDSTLLLRKLYSKQLNRK